MPLFHPRVLKRVGAQVAAIPDEHRRLFEIWKEKLENGTFDSETQNDAEFIQRVLVDVLGYTGSSSGECWTLAKNQTVGTGNVDVALGNFGQQAAAPQIIAPFELKGARTRDLDAVIAGRNKSPVQQAWEYAMDSPGAQWVLVSNYREIRLYAVGYGRKNYESFDLSKMTEVDSYGCFVSLLSAPALLSGTTRELLRESELVEKEITDELYEEYRSLRAALIEEIISQCRVEPMHAVQYSQTILDRILFIAFAEDRNLLKKGTLKEAFELKNPYSPQPAWENFKGLFNAIDVGNSRLNIPGYNGGLFARDEAIDALSISDRICERLAALGAYDYESEVSVTILGHIFEQSVTDIEEIKKGFSGDSARPVGVDSKRRADGIFYTPPFVTRHMVEQTLGKWLDDRKQELGFSSITPLTEEDLKSIQVATRGRNKGRVIFNENVRRHIALWESYKECVSTVRVLDPACGSGAFLNEVFDFLYREGTSINHQLEVLHGGQTSLFRWDTHILSNNIFGVDINRESVEITKLSLWLKTANRNEKLSHLEDNVKTGNSLIDDADVAGALAFDWRASFKRVMSSGGFDVVIGNPPYVDSETMTKTRPHERAYLTKTFAHTRGNWDLYVAFLEMGYNLLNKKGYLSFITPDKWISKDFGQSIREQVAPGLLSILPLGRDVFESALVDSIVTTIGREPVGRVQVLKLENGEVIKRAEYQKDGIDGVEGFDQFLSKSVPLLQKMEAIASHPLSDIARCENACATRDAYLLKEILVEAYDGVSYQPQSHYKVCNTGTLAKFVPRWGMKAMRYLKGDYLFPIVDRRAFRESMGDTYVRRAQSPKIIIKGLTLLDALLDEGAEFVPGKTTLVIPSDNLSALRFLCAFLNSRLISFYVKEKYASASYNGGVNFTPEMLNWIPVPDTLDRDALSVETANIIVAMRHIGHSNMRFRSMVASSLAPFKGPFDRWYEQDNVALLDELRRQGLTLSVTQRAEWHEALNLLRAEIVEHLEAVSASRVRIDDLVFAAFGLNAEDQKAVPAL